MNPHSEENEWKGVATIFAALTVLLIPFLVLLGFLGYMGWNAYQLHAEKEETEVGEGWVIGAAIVGFFLFCKAIGSLA